MFSWLGDIKTYRRPSREPCGNTKCLMHCCVPQKLEELCQCMPGWKDGLLDPMDVSRPREVILQKQTR